jgi:hypothetical protein
MKANAGLWIDHREAIIVMLSVTGEETKRIRSKVERQLRHSGKSANGASETQETQAEDSRDREYAGHLAHYYDEIISYLRDAGSILILGPGEAKGELKKRLEKHKGGTRIVAVETADKMTEPQVVATVRHHFLPDVVQTRGVPEHRDSARRLRRGQPGPPILGVPE